jgi:hypothetical protein
VPEEGGSLPACRAYDHDDYHDHDDGSAYDDYDSSAYDDDHDYGGACDAGVGLRESAVRC